MAVAENVVANLNSESSNGSATAGNTGAFDPYSAFMEGVTSAKSDPAPAESVPQPQPEASDPSPAPAPESSDSLAPEKKPADIHSPQFATLQAKFRELKAKELELKSAQDARKELDELKALRSQPSMLFDKLGLDPKQVADALIARAKSAEPSLPDSQLSLEVQAMRNEIAQLRKEKDDDRKLRQQVDQQKLLDSERQKAQKFLEDSKSHSVLAGLKGADLILAERDRHYAATSEVGEPEELDFAQAADIVEKKMRDELLGLAKNPEVAKLLRSVIEPTSSSTPPGPIVSSGPNLSSKFNGPTAPANPNATGAELLADTLKWLESAAKG